MDSFNGIENVSFSRQSSPAAEPLIPSDMAFRQTVASLFALPGGLGVILLNSGAATIGMLLIVLSVIGYVLSFSCLRLVNEWERLVVLRLGKFRGIRKPGMVLLFPLLDRVAARIDTRVQVNPFQAQQTLTRDTVPVDVDAVLFWYVFDAKKAALEVTDYSLAVAWASQTALRDIIGRSLLAELLSERTGLEKLLQELIVERANVWGIQIQAVEVRDVSIPAILQDAMSREAQAEREKKARVILSEAEKEIATNFLDAAKLYEHNQIALTLRGWNIIREGLKEKGNVVLIPTDTLNSLGDAGTAIALKQYLHNPTPENSPQNTLKYSAEDSQ
jgi:regulator of protease activity HflC (stomatin/prohibitin superfamily)